MIEVKKFERCTIVVLDGEPMPVRSAAKRLGLTKKALQKRIERGADLTMPSKRGSWAQQGL